MYLNNQPCLLFHSDFALWLKNVLDLELIEKRSDPLPPDERHRETCGHQFTSHCSVLSKRNFDLWTENEIHPLMVGIPIPPEC